jgi:hypothetical protein
MICENCGKPHDGNYGSGRFCCEKCARGFSSKHVSEEGRKKQREVLGDKKNREKTRNTKMSKSNNYELNSNGEWEKKLKSKNSKNKNNTESSGVGIYDNTKNKGKRHSMILGTIGELATAKKFLNHGYNVYVPLVDINGTDMIVEKNDGLKKIQVKSSSQSKNGDQRCTSFPLVGRDLHVKNKTVESHKKHYTKDSADYFALYSEHDDDIYLIENKGDNKSSITIRTDLGDNKGKQLKKIHRAEDYQIDRVLDNIDKGIDQSNIIEVDNYTEIDTEE